MSPYLLYPTCAIADYDFRVAAEFHDLRQRLLYRQFNRGSAHVSSASQGIRTHFSTKKEIEEILPYEARCGQFGCFGMIWEVGGGQILNTHVVILKEMR